MNYYSVKYINNVVNPTKLEAIDYNDAVKRAVGHFRKNSGHVETVSFLKAEEIIEYVKLIDGVEPDAK